MRGQPEARRDTVSSTFLLRLPSYSWPWPVEKPNKFVPGVRAYFGWWVWVLSF